MQKYPIRCFPVSKICGRCKKEKYSSEFYVRPEVKNGLAHWCKRCCIKHNSQPKDREKNRLKTWRRCHRNHWINSKDTPITPEEYKELFQKQGGKCLLCGGISWTQKGERKFTLDTDHEHKTGRVRGLLCSYCNLHVGHVENNTDLFRRILDYLGGSSHPKI